MEMDGSAPARTNTKTCGGYNEVEAKAMINQGWKRTECRRILFKAWMRCWQGILSLSGQRAGAEYRRFVQGKGVRAVFVKCDAFQQLEVK